MENALRNWIIDRLPARFAVRIPLMSEAKPLDRTLLSPNPFLNGRPNIRLTEGLKQTLRDLPVKPTCGSIGRVP